MRLFIDVYASSSPLLLYAAHSLCRGDHTETVDVEYDPTQTTYEALLDMFWKNHDPTRAASRQYMSAVFYRDEEQKRVAEESLKQEQKKSAKRIATSVVPLNEFTDAEL